MSRRLAATAEPVLGGNLDSSQDVFAGGRDDDADGIDLVVRGIGAVEHAGDRVKANFARDPRVAGRPEALRRRKECAVRFALIAAGTDGCALGRPERMAVISVWTSPELGGAMRHRRIGVTMRWTRRPSVASPDPTQTLSPARWERGFVAGSQSRRYHARTFEEIKILSGAVYREVAPRAGASRTFSRSAAMLEQTRFLLPEEAIPTSWYNLAADLRSHHRPSSIRHAPTDWSG